MDPQPSLTSRLQMFLDGDRRSADSLIAELWPKLRGIAAQRLQGERNIAFCPTDLINEFWMRSLSSRSLRIHSRGHFFALASHVMRNVLVDSARARLAEIRGGGQTVLSLDDMNVRNQISVEDDSTIVEIDRLLKQLASKSPDIAAIITMHYFAGFTFHEIARKTGLSFKQVRRRWDAGHQWLKRKLQPRLGRRIQDR
jgi:RNA polymerase sigma factor (TIGR02999 family)